MIRFAVESPVTCDTCGQPAVRRTVEAYHEGLGARMVSYDTHARCMADSRHSAALRRLDRFHEQLHALAFACRALPAEERKLSSGLITEIDFETVHPDACSIRTTIVPVAIIQAYGLRETLRLPGRALKNQTAAKLLEDIKAAAGPLLTRLAARFTNGDF